MRHENNLNMGNDKLRATPAARSLAHRMGVDLNAIAGSGYKGRIKTLGLPDEFISHGTPAEQKRYCRLDEDSIYDAAKALLGTTIEG